MARGNPEPLKEKFAHSQTLNTPHRGAHNAGSVGLCPTKFGKLLTPHAQKLCEWIKADPGVWPPGAGIMHPLSSKRAEAAKGRNS